MLILSLSLSLQTHSRRRILDVAIASSTAVDASPDPQAAVPLDAPECVSCLPSLLSFPIAGCISLSLFKHPARDVFRLHPLYDLFALRPSDRRATGKDRRASASSSQPDLTAKRAWLERERERETTVSLRKQPQIRSKRSDRRGKALEGAARSQLHTLLSG